MPGQVPYDDAHKVTTVFDMEMLKNLEKGEVARICLLEENAFMGVRHYIKDIGYIECQGDYDTVMREGSDPSKCVACKYATEGRDVPVSMPNRHFVAHILRYTTNNRGEPLKPLTFKIQAWSFSNDKYNILVDRQKNHGKLRAKDLLIKCTEKSWQRYDIDVVSGPALWTAMPELQTRVKELWHAEHHSDIDKLLCRKVDAQQMKEMVQRVLQRAPSEIAAEGLQEVGSTMSEADLDGLLDGVAAAPPASQKTAAPAVQAPTQQAPAATKAADPANVDLNFDDILKLP